MVQHQSSDQSFGERHYFFIRRLHSLCGVVPVGVFVCFHILANSTILAPGTPGAIYQQGIERIHALGPLLVPVEIAFIFIPLLFHALLGVQIWLTSKPNPQSYRYGSNLRYTLQRSTGMLAFVFILYHLWQMHWLGAGLGGGSFEVHDAAGNPTAASTTAAAMQSAWWIAPFYALGVVASVFHMANGIWTSLITWGITIRPSSQRASGYVCAAFGVAIGLAGLGSVYGFRNFESTPTVLTDSTVVEPGSVGQGH